MVSLPTTVHSYLQKILADILGLCLELINRIEAIFGRSFNFEYSHNI